MGQRRAGGQHSRVPSVVVGGSPLAPVLAGATAHQAGGQQEGEHGLHAVAPGCGAAAGGHVWGDAESMDEQ